MAKRKRITFKLNEATEVAGSNIRNGDPEKTYIVEVQRVVRDGIDKVRVAISFNTPVPYIVEILEYQFFDHDYFKTQVDACQGLLVNVPELF